MDYEVFREIYRVTEWKDGCVYRTEFVERKWVPEGTLRDPVDENLLYGMVSTNYEFANDEEFRGIRRRKTNKTGEVNAESS